VKEFYICRSYDQKSSVLFFGETVYIPVTKTFIFTI